MINLINYNWILIVFRLKGVLLYYDDLKFIGDLGRIIEDQPFIFWKVSGKFQVFYTSVGDIIRGKINKFDFKLITLWNDNNHHLLNRFGRGFFGCIIADCINATIHQPKNPPEDLSSYMKIDQEILFKVDKVELENAFIQGSITDECIKLIKENIEVINDDGMSLDCFIVLLIIYFILF